MRLSPSAPASSQALAIDTMSVTLGRELDVDRLGRHGLHGTRHLGGALRRDGAERHAAVAHVGTRDVHLDQIRYLLLARPYVRSSRRTPRPRSREMLAITGLWKNVRRRGSSCGDHGVDARVLQTPRR